MAINSFQMCDKIILKSTVPSNSKACALSPDMMMKINIGDGIASRAGKSKFKKKCTNIKSTQLTQHKQLLSRVTERRVVYNDKQASELVSSLPLAANIYKANSDEFNAMKRSNKKVKKSVLTLPNKPAPVPKTCTVSDMNDSEYYNGDDGNRKVKKRLPVQRKARDRNKDFEYYDRDARHCSQLDIGLDCSSTSLMKPTYGDKRRCKKQSYVETKVSTKEELNAHHVWAVLRNLNRFQFRPSPPASEESFLATKTEKKQSILLKKGRAGDRRVIETCCTEEFAYITEIEIASNNSSKNSRTSSFDRVTVIDKEDGFNMYKQIKKNAKTRMFPIRAKNNLKAISYDDNKVLLPPMHKKYESRKAQDKNNNDKPNRESSVNTLHRDIMSTDSSTCYRNISRKSSGKTAVSYLKENDEKIRSPPNNSVVAIENLALNKAKHDSFVEDKGKRHKGSSDESNQQTEMTEICKNKLTVTVSSNRTELLRSLRLAKTMPSAARIPKLTAGDIKKRISQIKFPLVIMEKDEVSSSFEVLNYEPVQFNGLDKPIWPFMINWYDSAYDGKDIKVRKENKIINKVIKDNRVKQNRRNAYYGERNILRKVNNEIYLNKSRDRRVTNNDIRTSKKTTEQKRLTQSAESNMTQQAKKSKPMRQFKDKRLRLLYKKPSSNEMLKGFDDEESYFDVVKLVDIGTETDTTMRYKFSENQTVVPLNMRTETLICKDLEGKQISVPSITIKSHTPVIEVLPPQQVAVATIMTSTDFSQDSRHRNLGSPNMINARRLTRNHKLPAARYTWGKRRFVSDLIENVIRKVMNGSYYSIASTGPKKSPILIVPAVEKNSQKISFKENHEHCMEIIPKLTVTKKYDPLETIPGFDDVLPDLEVKTLNINQISIKHCGTNVTVQFDVTVPQQPISIIEKVDNLSTRISISVTDSQTRVFKCQRSILNAILPAELCCMLPKIIRNFTNFKENLPALPTFPLVSVCKIEPNLPTITELTRCKSTVFVKPFNLPFWISPELRRLLIGKFTGVKLNPLTSNRVNMKKVMKDNYDHSNMKMLPLLLKLLCGKPLFSFNLNAFTKVSYNATEHKKTSLPKQNEQILPAIQMSKCTELQPYERLNISLLSAFQNFVLLGKLERNFNLNMQSLKMACYNDIFSVNLLIRNNMGLVKSMSVTISNSKLNSLFNGFSKSSGMGNNVGVSIIKIQSNKVPLKSIEYPINSDINEMIEKRKLCNPFGTYNKSRRRRFVRLYRKCKSTSYISNEKTTMSLSKITNIDDFFQAFGSGKMLSSVFDSHAERKILSSITELKSWITEISSRQALLVLLLTIKKDTQNLVRFRPVLLQGIAVNRITRATELDMEIEVIERENLNKLSQYEGISYLPSSNENLLEELCWIAKTTASDYQRPFDESSERLLKSLLEKRKKLNPSYLRVMARYVGLGLLKSPNKT